VATRYLSGVSVFLGDDITKREVTGEIAVVIGQATKGPSAPIQLKSPDNAIALYGTENPLTKGLFQFKDGFDDSPKAQNIVYVTMRIGGIKTALTTSYGLVLESNDAYTGLEDAFYIYVDDSSAESAKVKIWDSNKLVVYDSANDIDTDYFEVLELPTGESGKIYGVDIDNDPLETPVTIAQLVNEDIVYKGAAWLTPPASGVPVGSTVFTTADDVTLYPLTGTLVITEVKGAVTYREFLPYTLDKTTGTFTFTGTNSTAYAYTDSAEVGVVGSILTAGDSELDLTNREKYEKLRNALLDVEMYTPDYIIPCVPFDATETYAREYIETTQLKANTTNTSTTVTVDAAAEWPATGEVTLDDATNEAKVKYTAVTASGSDFVLTLDLPTFNIASVAGDKLSIIVEPDVSAVPLTRIPSKGYVKLTHGVTINYYAYTVDANDPAKLVFASAIDSSYIANDSVKISTGVFTAETTLVTNTWTKTESFELGLGFVKETDLGDHIEFSWSNTKLPGYYTAHFGYLIGKFCNDATVGYNTPLFGMNVTVPFASTPTRAQLVSWIGSLPEYKIVAGDAEAIEAVTKNGTGLLGNAILAGSKTYNRCYLSNPSASDFADPAFGLLLTDQGYVDGSPIKDDTDKLIDLGKFGCVGAGLLNFNNQASATTYIDSMGIYALGMLAGLPKNEGASFRKIGTGSNVTIGTIVSRSLYNDLARIGYIVPTREKALGWVVNNDPSVARDQSGYYLLSTTRTVKYVIEDKRSILVGFIGKPINTYNYEAAKTKLAESFTADIANGMLNGFRFSLEVVEAAKVMGKLVLNCAINPPLELVQVDINAVIDRNEKNTR